MLNFHLVLMSGVDSLISKSQVSIQLIVCTGTRTCGHATGQVTSQAAGLFSSKALFRGQNHKTRCS